MPKKSDLLMMLGWSDELIRHFMVDDAGEVEQDNDNQIVEVYDTRTLMVDFNSSQSAGSNIIVTH